MIGATIETREERPVPHLEELWHGSLTIPEVFPDRLPDYTQNTLWEAPAAVAVFRDSEDAGVFRVSFPANPICGFDLVHLLEAARPKPGYRGEQTRRGILDDWQISTDPANDLYQMHEKYLGHYWTEFVNNDLPPLMEAINIVPASETKRMFQEMIGRLKNGWQTLNEKPQLLERIERFKRYFDRKHTRSHLEGDGCIKYFDFFLGGARIGIYPALVALRAYPGLICHNPRREDFFRDPRYPILSSIETLENERFKLTHGKFTVTVAFADGRIEEIERFIPQPKGELTPMVAWRTKKNGNKPIRESLDVELSPQLLQGVDGHAHSLLGLIVAAALSSDEERAILPKELPLHAGGKRQVMMAAQMPLLIEMSKKRLLEKLSFFQRIETCVGEILGIRL